MTFLNLIKRDIQFIVSHIYKRFLIVISILFLLVFILHYQFDKLSSLDIMLYFFKGISKEQLDNKIFIFPICWLVFHLSSSFILSDVLKNDIFNFSPYILIKRISRKKIWISKVVVLLVFSLFFNLLFFGISTIFISIITKYIGNINDMVFLPDMSNVSVSFLYMYLFIIQFLVTVLLNMIYFLCNLILPAIYSFLVNISLLVFIMMVYIPLNPLNYSMVSRINLSSNLLIWEPILGVFIIIIILLGISYYIFNHLEFLDSKEGT
ncbi:hypothetical protein ORL93_29080 [Bacillus sp. DHT2]|uniref:hypothetical protein n=1 Tax=Bacillus pseudomycoides TaxID=64104 RepID=UPI0028680698|nr:hypothetical protein [Bacillus pseudomycoides]MCX2829660.1 hypothetical protein [Bacillus sp. DHT2]